MPKSQGVLVAGAGAGLSLESAHTKTIFCLSRTKLSDTICSDSSLNSGSWRLTVNHMWSRVSKSREVYRCVMGFIVVINASSSNRSCLEPTLKKQVALSFMRN